MVDHGVRVALIVAAAVCLTVGLAWDHFVGTTDHGHLDEAAVVAAQQWESVDGLGRERELVHVSFRHGDTTAQQATPAPQAAAEEEVPRTSRGASVADDARAGERAPETTTTTTTTLEKVTVKRGDTPRTISERVYGTGQYWRDILEANGLEPGDALEPGQTLRVPAVSR